MVPDNLWDDLLLDVEPRFLPNNNDDSIPSTTPDLGVTVQPHAVEHNNTSHSDGDQNESSYDEAVTTEPNMCKCIIKHKPKEINTE